MNRSEDEAMEEETEEETRRMKKMRLTTTTNNVGGATSSKPKRQTGRKKDEAWKHVVELAEGQNQCKYCQQIFYGGASRIKEHLGLRTNKGNIKVCPNYPPTSTTSSPRRKSRYDPNPTLTSLPSPPHLQHDPNPIVSLETKISCFPSDSHPTIPSSVSLQHHQLSLQTEVEKYIQIVKESWNNTGLTLKVHFKTRYNELFKESNIVGYTAYCPKGIIFLDFKKMRDEIKKDMKNEITQIIYDLDLEKDDCHGMSEVDGIISTTHCANVSLCVQGVIIHFLHTICEKCDWLVDLIKKAKSMYVTMEESPMVASKFNHYPLFELQTIVQNKEKFESIFRGQSETNFWKDMEEVLSVVGPLIKILNLFDNFVPSIGYFFEAMEMAEKRIKHCPEKLKLLWEHFGLLKSDAIMPIHVTTAYLNPSYMHDESSIKDKINEEEVREHLKDLLRSEEEQGIAAKVIKQLILEMELAKYSKKDTSLFTEDAIKMLKKYHPVIWWKTFGDVVPILRHCAVRLLSQPSNCLSHLRHKPKFEVLNFDDPDVFRLNVTMMDEFKKLEENNEIYKPIDLSIINAPLN